MQALRDTFDANGFVVVRRFLSATELEELSVQLDRYIRHVVPALRATEAFYQDRRRPETLKQLQHMAREPYFARYRGHPRWVELAEALLGEPAEAMEPEWFNKPPATAHPTPPHQDNYYFCFRPPRAVTLWLALDRIDEENGCLRYVAGSHDRGLRAHEATEVLGFSQGIKDYDQVDRDYEVAVCLDRGDLVAHHCETIHRADPNRSEDRHRRAFAMVFQGTSCRRDEAAYARYTRAFEEQHRSLYKDIGKLDGLDNS